MAEGTNLNLSLTGDLGKPANTLIEKVSKAIGVLYEPTRIRREARARADAAMIAALGENEVLDIQRRAANRFVEEETRKQINIENIIRKSLPYLNDDADASQMDDDWVASFFDRCRLTCDDEMQSYWAKILSGEANRKGAFSRRLLNIVSELDKSEAEQFTCLCGYAWRLSKPRLVIYDYSHEIYKFDEVSVANYDILVNLENAGLIKLSAHPLSIVQSFVDYLVSMDYFGKTMYLDFKGKHGKIDMGFVAFTKAGEELYKICNAVPVDGYFEYVANRFGDRVWRRS